MAISPPIQAATIGMGDSLLLMVIALVVLGPRRLPQVGRQIGKLMYEFRKASNDFKYQMEEELRNAEEADRRKREEAERQKALSAAQTAVAQAQTAAEQALQAAAQAQSAAQAAQSAADFRPPDTAVPAEPSASESAPAEPGMIYTYSYESVTAAETATPKPPVSEPAAESTASGLRVQPPATGEPVPASRPGRASRAPRPSAPALPEEINVKKEAVAAEASAAAEPAAHHG